MDKKTIALAAIAFALLSLGTAEAVSPGAFMYFRDTFSQTEPGIEAQTRDVVPVSVPYQADFTSPELPAGWNQTSTDGLPSTRWIYSSGMWMCFGTPGIGTTRLISPPIDTSGLSDLAVTFATFYYPQGGGITYKLEYSHDGANWYDLNWSVSSTPFYSYMTDALIGINAPLTYFSWTLEGNQENLDAAGMFQVLLHEFLPPEITMSRTGLITWGTANVPSYKILASDTPDGTYTQVGHTSGTSWQIPFSHPQRFFQVVSSTDILEPITSLPALPVIDRGRWKGRESGRPMER